MGNPLKWRNAAMIEWYGRQMTLFGHSNGEVTTYTYNADGIRTVKQHSDADGNVVGTTKYTLDGTKIIAENRNGSKIYYTYDDKGAIMGMIYGGVSYVFSKNLQGDVIGIYNESGDLVAKYEYNAFGKITAITDASGNDVSGNASHVANINPFRYRGYYYDTETGFYYLQSRYYDAVIGRFINSDIIDVITATPAALTDKNLYAYCDNNPIIRIDNEGRFWDTIFDVGSFFYSVYEVCTDPSDPWAWAGLVGDTVDLIPFVSGTGETVRFAKTTNKIVDTVDTAYDAAKTVDRIDDVADTAKIAQKGWRVGDDITNLTKAGNVPKWSTIRQRYWKNQAYYHPELYPDDLCRLKKGLAPIGMDGCPMELHHPYGRYGDDLFIFQPLTQTQHRFYHYGW